MEDTINKAIDYVGQVFSNDFSTLVHSLDVYCLVKNLYGKLPYNIAVNIDLANLLSAALLHDIGKKPIPQGILRKPCELTAYEKELVKHHTVYGKKMLKKTAFEDIAEWVFYHHEREDGNGYYGLAKEQTPIESKIIAVADTFSALTLTRAYRKSSSAAKAVVILKEVAGTQLDTDIVAIFCGMAKKQRAFKRRVELYKLLIPLMLKARLHF